MTEKPADIAVSLNNFLERAMPLLTPIGVILGIVFYRTFIPLRPYVPWLFGIMTLSGALKLKGRELGMSIRKPLPIAFFFVAAHILMPLTALLITRLIFRDDTDTISGFILIYCTPTAVTGLIWTSIFRGDTALSLAVILLDTLAAPIVVPGTIHLLLGTDVQLDMTGIALSLIMMVVIPTIIGVTVNETSRGKIPALIGPYLAPFSKLILIFVIAANCSAVATRINLKEKWFWIIGLTCVVLSTLGFVLAKLAGVAGRFSRDKQASLFFASGLRNISAAMTLGIEFFPGPAALPSVLGIIFQQSIAAVMGRLFLGKNVGEVRK
jgi:tagaturonate reductase